MPARLRAPAARRSRSRRGGPATRARALRTRLLGRRRPDESEALRRAKARLDLLDFYARPVRIEGVRILHVPWLFGLPWFRRFHGYEMGPLILLKHPLRDTSEDLVVHELCHVWQDQNRRLRLWASYLYRGYRDNPHEVEARRAVAETR